MTQAFVHGFLNLWSHLRFLSQRTCLMVFRRCFRVGRVQSTAAAGWFEAVPSKCESRRARLSHLLPRVPTMGFPFSPGPACAPTRVLPATARCWIVGLMGGFLLASFAGCLTPALHDEHTRPEVPLAVDGELAREALRTYAVGLQQVFNEASQRSELRPSELHEDLSARISTIRRAAFAPIDARLEEVMNRQPLDELQARNLLKELSQGFAAAIP
ncbi:hypothetical protein A6X21_11065 [Planctopirus hydrillae]|uniref:Uncharacterized protein n=2 Tax=Planctopirus hydrillae TaxID=1841610 RepID=A0A1C3E6B3_9PLAN|nr:hypothetical protein A6X21_11065 [Planctopirus hydrillae]